jgi:hypothetical protein
MDQPSQHSMASLIGAEQKADLLYVDPRQQLGVLDEFYPDGAATLDRCLPVHEAMAPNAVGLFHVRLRDLAVVQGELLPRCGFGLWRRMLPLEHRPPAQLPRTRVLLVAVRGQPDLALPPIGDWTFPPPGTDPMAIAERLFPAANRRLQIFADANRPGWISLSPAETWIDPPTLR